MQRDLVLYMYNLKTDFNKLSHSRMTTSVMTGHYTHIEYGTKMFQTRKQELPDIMAHNFVPEWMTLDGNS